MEIFSNESILKKVGSPIGYYTGSKILKMYPEMNKDIKDIQRLSIKIQNSVEYHLKIRKYIYKKK